MDGWYSKWQSLNRLKETSYTSSKNMSNFRLIIKTLLKEVYDLNISMKEYVLVKIINLLGPTFKTYVTILNKKARTKTALPNLEALLKSLEKEKIRLTGKNLLNIL